MKQLLTQRETEIIKGIHKVKGANKSSAKKNIANRARDLENFGFKSVVESTNPIL